MMTKEEIYKAAIKRWGRLSQIEMIVEECSELIQAIQKQKRYGNIENVIEEIADVEIMCEQARMLFDTGGKVDIAKDFKINRLKERLKL